MPYISGTIVAVGDSITLGLGGAADDYANIVKTDLGGISVVHYKAYGGIGWNVTAGGSNLIQRGAADADIYVADSPQPFLFLFAGTNDMGGGATGAQTYAYFQTYIEARIQAGWVSNRIIVVLMLSRDVSVSNAERMIYNNALIAGAATYGYLVARTDLNANIGAQNSYLNATYFGDQLHPTTAGQQQIANVVEPIAYVSGKVRRLVKIGS